MSDYDLPHASSLQLCGLTLVVAAVLMLAGVMSPRWMDGHKVAWSVYGNIDEVVELGPQGIRKCDDHGCDNWSWKALPEHKTPRTLTLLVGFGELLAAGWALVVGLLAMGGSVRILRPTWIRWPLAAIAALALLLLTFMMMEVENGQFGEGAVFGIVGPALAWFAVARLAHPFFRSLALTGDPTGATLR